MFAWFRSLFARSEAGERMSPAQSRTRSPTEHDNAPSADAGAVIHIHEDDWGMRNLVPVEAIEEASRDIEAAGNFGTEHQHPSGFGWTEMYQAKEPSMGYSGAGLTLVAAAEVLARVMPRVQQFRATIFSYIGREDRDPYGSYEDDAWAFGFGHHCYIKLDREGDLVKSIWFDLQSDDPADVSALRRSIKAINDLIPSAISDYFLEAVVRVGDDQAMDAYFQDRLDQIERARAQILAMRAERAGQQ